MSTVGCPCREHRNHSRTPGPSLGHAHTGPLSTWPGLRGGDGNQLPAAPEGPAAWCSVSEEERKTRHSTALLQPERKPRSFRKADVRTICIVNSVSKNHIHLAQRPGDGQRHLWKELAVPVGFR